MPVIAAAKSVLEKLAPERRVAVVLALVGLGLVGVLLVVITMLAARWARHHRPPRNSRIRFAPRDRTRQADPSVTDHGGQPNETIVNHRGDEDTQA